MGERMTENLILYRKPSNASTMNHASLRERLGAHY
jgi:hypothetical protein